MPRWLRRALLGLLALVLLTIGLVSCHEVVKPWSLATASLSGPRLVTGPICIEEAVDVSGSMTQFTHQREQAEQAFFAFAKRQLLGTDSISEAYFASTAKVSQAPTSIAALASSPAIPAGIDYNSTLLSSAVTALAQARPGGDHCASRALVVITDGVIYDPPTTIDTVLNAAAYTRMYAVIPSATGWGRPPELDGGARSSITVYHFTDPGFSGRVASVLADARPLDVVFGDIAAALTGQTLVQTK